VASGTSHDNSGGAVTPDYRLVYFAKRRGIYAKRRLIKIGITTDLDQRMRALKLDLVFAVVCEHRQARDLEAALHAQFSDWRLDHYGSTEWFEMNDMMEWLIGHVRRTKRWPWDLDAEVIL
jgi:hypothetical protein